MLSGLLNIGNSALNASQAWISVTGNNLANADTEGYSRQYVDQKDAGGLTYRPGAQPLGVNAQQIMRFFDQFLEKSYVRQNANSSRWSQQDTIMASVENLFNEANRVGINSAMNNFFNAWQDLTLRPDDTSVRQSLLSYADNMADMFQGTMNSLKNIQDEMDVSIRQGVDRVNDIAVAIADLNRQITATTVDGINNPNSLLDKRDQLVRELSEYVDVETIDHGKGDFRVQLTTGQPLVDGTETYSLAFLAAQKENQLLPGSNYAGTVNFQGSDEFEYTIEVANGGELAFDDNGKLKQPVPSIKVSLDGGKTWIKNANGEEEFALSATKDENENITVDDIKIKELTLSFTEAENFNKGDRFNITPKTGLYWIEPTRGPQNITPQIGLNGVDNPNRVTGGKLAAYFNVRDDNIGRYKDELNAVANSVIWEVNRIHSQGAGLQKLESVVGSERVGNTTAPLGSAQAMLANYDKLQKGGIQFHVYNNLDEKIDSFTIDFDPSESLNEFVEKFAEHGITAQIQDGKLLLEPTQNGTKFALGVDSTGLMAALGVNTFFSGSSATDIAVNDAVHMNTQLIAAGQVNGAGEINPGDNATATAIGKLATKPVTISTFWKTVDNQSISQYYANLVSTVGTDRRLTKTNTEYHGALTNDLYERVTSVTGVNMDEEMSNLIKYQHSYTAAAKLITTADEMLQTLLGLKQ
ncbi:MAG: flagellar hook-associated protein FlgK [Desulfovibrio sp.]|nr:flagellar hook-associated protein FlgK [Desulfovibrio sp.]